MNWLEDDKGNRYVRKQVFLQFTKEEIDWVVINCLRARSVNDSSRGKALNLMIGAFLQNPKGRTWIIDKSHDIRRSLLFDLEGHYLDDDMYMIYSGDELFEIVR